MTNKSITTFFVTIFFILGASFATGALREYTGTVNRILVDEGYYGGCMAEMIPSIRDQGINCGTWVSFDCNGTYGSKSDGRNMLSSAQLALVTGTQIFLVLDTNKKFQELYCKAVRVDNLAPQT